MRKVLEQCPSCSGALVITELTCPTCATTIRGRYAPCRFCSLSPEDMAFLELFIKNRGNVKEMERELGISYWTIRSRLDDVVARIGFDPPIDEHKHELRRQRQKILERLDQGEITVSEAADLLTRSEP